VLGALKIACRLLAFATAAVLSSKTPSSAFFDDLCFSSNGALGNCLANSTPYCSITGDCVPISCGADAASEQNSQCFGPVNFVAGGDPKARSMVHADSVYLLAQAVGLDARAAYFIATYGDTPDKIGEFILMVPALGGRYAPYQDPQHKTLPLPDLVRGSALGTSIHFPLVTDAPQIAPDPTDSIHEGVSRLRSWALGDEFEIFQTPCLGGLTFQNRVTLSYFSGERCYVSTSIPPFSFEGGTYGVNQSVNVTASPSYQSGDQPFQSSSYEGIQAQDAPVFAGDLRHLLNLSPARLADGVTPVPLALLKIGVYLHSLMDRVSHTPALVPLTLSGPPANRTFDGALSFPFSHAYLHFEEVGIPTLSRRTETALGLAYDELQVFARQHPEFIAKNRRVTAKSEVVSPLVNLVLNQRSAAVRLTRLDTLSRTLGYASLTQPSLP
jgi:hypothetical protein